MAKSIRAITLLIAAVAVALLAAASTSAAKAQEGSSLTDRQLLIGLYLSTGGPATWTNRDGWLSNNPINEWHGVGVNRAGRVIRLTLPNNGLTGRIPSGVDRLLGSTGVSLALEKVDFSGNQLSGEIPPSFVNLAPNLETLNFSRNQLSGPIPAELGRLSRLKELDLDYNSLSGNLPPELGSLSNLSVLRLGSNDLTGPIPPEWRQLRSLTILGLGNNTLTGRIPPELGQLSNLTRFSVWENVLSGPIPPQLGRLSRLTKLTLGNNLLSGEIPAELTRLSNLEDLGLSGNALTGCIPNALLEIPTNDFHRLDLPPCDLPKTESKYDTDGDGLIEISNLEQLDAIRYDNDGDGVPNTPAGDAAAADEAAYAAAFPTGAGESVCNECNGYDLTRSLDFKDPGSYASGRVNTAWTTGQGWLPILSHNGSYHTFRPGFVFDGNRHVIANLYVNRPNVAAEHGHGEAGLFTRIGAEATVRNIGLVDVDVTGPSAGALAGRLEGGSITRSYATGEVSGEWSAGGLVASNERVGRSIGGSATEWFTPSITASYASVKVSSSMGSSGGLVGISDGDITASYAAGNVSGDGTSGGLVGSSYGGSITASYATGDASGGHNAGGLVGSNGGSVTASYATGNVSGREAGGLVGRNYGSITASYAAGKVMVNSGAGYLGGLVGSNDVTHEVNDDGDVIRRFIPVISYSYWDTETSGQATGIGQRPGATEDQNVPGLAGKTTRELQAPTGYTGIYAAWDDTGAGDVWHFSSGSQYPALKVDLDGDGTATWQEFGRQRTGQSTPPPAEEPVQEPEAPPEEEQDHEPEAPLDREKLADLLQNLLRPVNPLDSLLGYLADLGPDRVALISLYHSAGGEDWTRKDGWLEAQSLDDWYGVTVVNGRVVKIDLRGNGLSGKLTSSIRRLTALRELHLNRNELSGTLPSALAELNNLVSLNLSDNQFSGPPPAGLERLAKLKLLRLDENVLSGELGWGQDKELDQPFASLEYLYLGDNSLRGGISVLGNFRSLKTLDIGNNNFSGPVPETLGDLTALTTLLLNGNSGLSGCVPLELKFQTRLRNVTPLPFCPPPEHREEKVALATLYVDTKGSGNHKALIDRYEILKDNLGDRNGVKLNKGYETGGGRPWNEREDDHIGNWWIEKAEGTEWATSFYYPPGSGTLFIEYIYQNAGWLTQGNWSNWRWESARNPISTWEGVTVHERTGHVIGLDLSGNNLRGEIPPELGNLTHLQWLDLSGNSLDGNIPNELSDLSNLERLDLSSNNLEGAIPQEFRNLKSLTHLNLSSNSLSEYIPWQLREMLPRYRGSLENLYLYDNQLKGCIPRSLLTQLEDDMEEALAAIKRTNTASYDWDWALPKDWENAVNGWIRPTYGLWLPPCAPPPPELALEELALEELVLGERALEDAHEDHSTDKLALLAIKNHFVSAGSDSDEFSHWKDDNLNLLTPRDGCGVGGWHGVETASRDTWTGNSYSETCRIIGLSLDKRELKGTIPKEIGYLTKLETLNLSHNCLRGSIPAELGHLRELKSLGLNSQGSRYVKQCESRSSLSGELPPEFGRLRSLTMLNLFDNPGLNGELPLEFGNLTQLEHIKLEHTGFNGCMPPPLVQNFAAPLATDVVAPLLAFGAVTAFTAITKVPLHFVAKRIISPIISKTIGTVLDPVIKPGAEHSVPWLGSELHGVELYCGQAP